MEDKHNRLVEKKGNPQNLILSSAVLILHNDGYAISTEYTWIQTSTIAEERNLGSKSEVKLVR